jgi:hypothetical protein
MISWSSTPAGANTKIIWSCFHTAIFFSAAVMTGTGSMIPPAKLGHFSNREDLIRQAHGESCENKPQRE